VVNFTPRQLYAYPPTPFVKEARYSLNTVLVGSQSRFERFVEEKDRLLLLGFEPRIVQPVAYATAEKNFKTRTKYTV
jgi:hypothetical protein